MPDVHRRHNVKLAGAGATTLVFAHGFGCDQTMWRLVAPAFEASHRVLTFDYAGAGGAEPGAYDGRRHARLEGYVDDVLAVLEAAWAGPVVFVGHSVSAIIGLLASLRRPEWFERLVLVCPSPRYLDDPSQGYHGGFTRADIEGLLGLMEKNPLGWPDFFAPAVMGNPERPELAEELRGSFCRLEPRAALQFAAATFWADNRADLAKVSRPCLVLQCRADTIAPEAVGRYTHERLAGSRFHLLEASGHCPHLSHPEETIAAIRAYLAEAV